jgi:Domain of unknown function (DUF4347)/Hint domain
MSLFSDYLTNIKPLVHPEIIGPKNQFTNILLINSQVQNYQTFVNSVNSSTFPIVYSVMSSKTELLTLLQANFTTISRIGIVFNSSLENVKIFLDSKPLFLNSEEGSYSENLQFIIEVIKEFQVKNIDYLACNTLKYSNWVNYYDILTQQTGVVVGASNDKTGNIKYGGDWIMESTSQDIELVYWTNSVEYYSYLLDDPTPWVTTGASPLNIAVYGDYMYVSCFLGGIIQRIDMRAQTPSLVTWVSGLGNPDGLVINGDYMYVACFIDGTIQRIDMRTQPRSLVTWVSGLRNPTGLVINRHYMYVGCNADGTIQRIDMRAKTPSPVPWVSGLRNPIGLVIDGDYMYVACDTIDNVGSIQQIYMRAETPSHVTWVSAGIRNPYFMVIYRNYMYVSNANFFDGGFISQINLSDPSQVVNYASISVEPLSGLEIYQNNLYTSSPFSNEIYQIALSPLPLTCFKEDTKILTDKGYKPIQDLRKGDLVKTLKHDYKAIDMIGKREIYHPASKERIKDQLYKCSQNEYPEIFEPLIITGCHCILEDNFKSEEQKEKVIEVNGNVYITDNKYRIPACADLRASVYEDAGNHTIYHLALENDDYYMNYGVYANGLLVETCSKRYLKELSNMTLIE